MFGRTVVVFLALLELSLCQLESCQVIRRRMREEGIRVFRNSKLQGGCPLECLDGPLVSTRYYCCGSSGFTFFPTEVVDLSTGRLSTRCVLASPFSPPPGVPVTVRPLPTRPPFCSNQQSANPDDFALDVYTNDTRNSGLVESFTCRYILVRGGFPFGERRVTIYDCIDGYTRFRESTGYSCILEEDTTAVTDFSETIPTPEDVDMCPFEVVDNISNFRRQAYSDESQDIIVKRRCFFEETRNGVTARVRMLNYYECPDGTNREENPQNGLFDCE